MFHALLLGLTFSGNAGLWSGQDGTLSITAMDDWESPIALRSYGAYGGAGALVSYTEDSCRLDQKVLGCSNGTTNEIVFDCGDGIVCDSGDGIALVQGADGLVVTGGGDHFPGGCGFMDYTDDACLAAHTGAADVHCGIIGPEFDAGIIGPEHVWNVQLDAARGWTVSTRMEATGRGALNGAFDGGVLCATFGADGARVATTVVPLRNFDRFLADPSDAQGVTGALGLVYQKIEW